MKWLVANNDWLTKYAASTTPSIKRHAINPPKDWHAAVAVEIIPPSEY
jgi:hypothetical protein